MLPVLTALRDRARVEVEVEIDATVAEVWAVVEPIERHVEWMHDAVAIRFEGERTRGVGTRFLCDTRVGPIRLVDRMEITEWQPESVMGVRHAGVVTGSGRFTLAPLDLGRRTRFRWDEQLVFPWWMGGVLGAVIGGRLVLRPIWRRNLNELRRLVERES